MVIILEGEANATNRWRCIDSPSFLHISQVSAILVSKNTQKMRVQALVINRRAVLNVEIWNERPVSV